MLLAVYRYLHTAAWWADPLGEPFVPIHDYTCTKCKHNFELLVMPSTVPACPSCGSTRLQKLISAPIAPGKSAAIMTAGRARAAKAGHTSHYKRSGGKIVD